MSTEPFSLCVYCGSRRGAQAEFAEAADAVGEEIGRRGWQLVYGGGQVGLMGIVADAALRHGARVVGVIPRVLMEKEVGHARLSEQHVVETMHQRKHMMAQRAHAFLALPGGIGTLEELYEVWTWRQLGYHHKPIGLLNVSGFYDTLLGFMDQVRAQGFLGTEQLALVHHHTQVAPMLDTLHRQATGTSGSDNFSRI